MLRRDALVLPRMPAARPSAPPAGRVLVFALGVAAALALGYLAARQTSLFALRSVEIAGAPPHVEAQVRAALRPLAGSSLVALDGAEVEARLRAVPSVRSARVDRAFPDTLAVVVRPERALAVIRDRREAWLVAESGRVVAPIEPTARPRLPRVRTELEAPLRVGSTVATEDVRVALGVLRAVPRRFPARVLYAAAEPGSVVLVLRGGAELRLGPPREIDAKLRAAAAVLRSLDATELSLLGYVDASAPTSVVTGPMSQLEGES